MTISTARGRPVKITSAVPNIFSRRAPRPEVDPLLDEEEIAGLPVGAHGLEVQVDRVRHLVIDDAAFELAADQGARLEPVLERDLAAAWAAVPASAYSLGGASMPAHARIEPGQLRQRWALEAGSLACSGISRPPRSSR